MSRISLEHRPDLRIIAEMIPRGARVLDLGCGEGDLLAWLRDHREVNGYGLEIDPGSVTRCLQRGVNVIERDIDVDLSDFPSGSFDVVVLAETLQAVRHPDRVLEEMLRIAPRGIVTIPNFGHWRCRAYLALRGRMPVSSHLPHSWYETPNIHLCTVADFESLCRERGFRLQHRELVNPDYEPSTLIDLWPNQFASLAIYGLERSSS